jgi:hypothetical protein
MKHFDESVKTPSSPLPSFLNHFKMRMQAKIKIADRDRSIIDNIDNLDPERCKSWHNLGLPNDWTTNKGAFSKWFEQKMYNPFQQCKYACTLSSGH